MRLMSALPLKADIAETRRHVRLVPCVDGSKLARRIFTSHCWSVQPCVRPVSAAHEAAGVSIDESQTRPGLCPQAPHPAAHTIALRLRYHAMEPPFCAWP